MKRNIKGWVKGLYDKEWIRFAQDIAPFNLDESLPGRPVVGRWPGYKGGEVPYPHAQYEGKYVLGLIGLYQKEKDEKLLMRAKEVADFLLWSQYDKDGYSRLSRIKSPLWKYGWPDHNFRWRSGNIYTWKEYDPIHHEEAICIISLVKVFELTKERKYLESCKNWVDYQVPRYGFSPGKWGNYEYHFTCYNPIDVEDISPGRDAVNNVQSLISMALASTGYHLKDKKMLENAYKLLIYLCKEQREDGFWHYCGSEWFEDFGENIPSLGYEVCYMQGQLWEMSIAVEYLEKSDIGEIAPIEESIDKGEEFLANNRFRKLVKHPTRRKDSGFKEA